MLSPARSPCLPFSLFINLIFHSEAKPPHCQPITAIQPKPARKLNYCSSTSPTSSLLMYDTNLNKMLMLHEMYKKNCKSLFTTQTENVKVWYITIYHCICCLMVAYLTKVKSRWATNLQNKRREKGFHNLWNDFRISLFITNLQRLI